MRHGRGTWFSRSASMWLAGAAALVQFACARPLVLQGKVAAWESPPPGSASFVLVDSNAFPAPMRLHPIAGARIRLTRPGAADIETTSGPDGSFTLAGSARVFRQWTVVVEAPGCQALAPTSASDSPRAIGLGGARLRSVA